MSDADYDKTLLAIFKDGFFMAELKLISNLCLNNLISISRIAFFELCSTHLCQLIGLHTEDCSFYKFPEKNSFLFYFQSVSLFSYVGGYLGLWLGISLVAICDVLETAVLVIRWTIRKCSRRRKFKNRVHSRQRMLFDDAAGQMWFL